MKYKYLSSSCSFFLAQGHQAALSRFPCIPCCGRDLPCRSLSPPYKPRVVFRPSLCCWNCCCCSLLPCWCSSCLNCIKKILYSTFKNIQLKFTDIIHNYVDFFGQYLLLHTPSLQSLRLSHLSEWFLEKIVMSDLSQSSMLKSRTMKFCVKIFGIYTFSNKGNPD